LLSYDGQLGSYDGLRHPEKGPIHFRYCLLVVHHG
jgi:hypothetical protein